MVDLKRIFGFGLILVFLSGCGEMPSDTGQSGSISFGLGIEQSGQAKLFAPGISCTTTGIATIRINVLDMNNIKVATADFNCAAGTGVVNGVPSGSGLSVVVRGLDAGGGVIYMVVKSGVVVQSGANTDLGKLIMTLIATGNWSSAVWGGSTWGP